MMHPDYDDRTLSNDICLLELDEPFYMDEYVSFYLNRLLKNDRGVEPVFYWLVSFFE